VIENKYMDVISDRTDVLKILPEAAAELCTALFRNSPAGIYITRDGKFIYTNIEFRRITGYSQQELSGKDYLRLINPRYRQMPKQNMASLFEEEETETSHEFKITTHEGKKKWISEKITYFKYGGNWLTLGHWLDVSDHHSVEKAWREAERRFQLAFEDISTGLTVIGTDGIFLKVNKSFCDMLGLEEREILESRFDDVLCPDDRSACGDIMSLFLSMEKPEEPLQMRLQSKDGRIIWTAMSISLIGDNEAGPSYFMVNFQDITEQKRREEGLREEERLYHSLVDLSIEPVAVTDLDCHFTHVSHNFFTLLGYETGQDLLGKKISNIVSGEGSQAAEPQILEMLKHGTPGSISHNLLKKDGSLLPMQMHVAWINKDNGSPLCIVISLRTPVEQKTTGKQPAAEMDATATQAETKPVEKPSESGATAGQAAPAQFVVHPLSAALENTTTALILLNLETIIVACNAAFEKLSGYSRQEIEGKKSWIEFVAKEDQPRLKKYYLLRRLDPTSSPNTYEFKFANRDGDIHDVLINISPVAGTNQLAATLLDLAEYKQALAGAQASEQNTTTTETETVVEESPDVPVVQPAGPGNIYRDVLEASPNAIVITDMDGTVTFASRNAFERIGGFKPEMMLGKNFRRFIRPGMLESVNEAIEKLKNTGFLAETEFDMLRHDGRIINCEVSASVITEEDGPSYMAFVIRDITVRKQAYDTLAEKEKSYRWMAENSTDSMWLMDLDLNIVWSNNVLGKLRGFTIEEARSMPFDQHLLPDSFRSITDYYTSWIRDLKAVTPGTPHSHNMELQFFRKDGSVMSAECTFSLIEDDQGQAAGLLGIAHDISGRKHAEEHAARSLAQLDKTLHGAIAAMIRIVEMRDPYTSGHQDRVAALAGAIAREIGLPADLVKGIEITARIHDIGKVYIPMEILSKPGTFTEVERQIIQSHAQGSYDILKIIDFPWPVAEAAFQHHERLDGSGYPRGLKENQIILEAKILMVADVVEAMASHRPYRPSCGIDAALEEISVKSGLLYDSTIVDYCLKLFREGRFSFNDTFSGEK
jgi:PAS domain S-box-containing protein